MFSANSTEYTEPAKIARHFLKANSSISLTAKSVPFPENQFQHVSPKSAKRPRTLNELNDNEDLSPVFKKIRETAVNVMNETTRVCEKNGESLSTVLGECCSLSRKARHDAQEVFRSVFDSFTWE